jgi:ribosomal protein L16 Arg81 hydroxylase
MTMLEKRQQLIQRVQEIPDSTVDEINTLLDAMLEQKKERDERFSKLLTETSKKYKAVWEALA